MAVFHQGELAIQQQVGVQQQAKAIGEAYIRDYLPLQHQEFFSQQGLLFAGLLDDHGHPWASPLVGEPGFIQAPNSQCLSIEGRVLLESSNRVTLSQGDPLALLGVEFDSRRRNRVNGELSYATSSLLRLAVKQSFGNCPKYIQQRHVCWHYAASREQPKPQDFEVVKLTDEHIQSQLAHCDTFFIASRSAALNPASGGVDISHRGGKPGFVRCCQGKYLIIPDFSGNNYFNTLGNIHQDKRVGLYIPDFVSPGCLWIKGLAKILSEVGQRYRYSGAQRYLLIAVEQLLMLTTQGIKQNGPTQLSPALSVTGDYRADKLVGHLAYR